MITRWARVAAVAVLAAACFAVGTAPSEAVVSSSCGGPVGPSGTATCEFFVAAPNVRASVGATSNDGGHVWVTVEITDPRTGASLASCDGHGFDGTGTCDAGGGLGTPDVPVVTLPAGVPLVCTATVWRSGTGGTGNFSCASWL